jgi:hypothetical protein
VVVVGYLAWLSFHAVLYGVLFKELFLASTGPPRELLNEVAARPFGKTVFPGVEAPIGTNIGTSIRTSIGPGRGHCYVLQS